jgi:DNA-binding transcriptional LysR family regulator
LRAPWDLRAYASLQHIFVSLSGATRGMIDDELEAKGLRRNCILTLAGDGAVGEVVAATDLVATVPDSLAKRIAGDGKLTIVELPFAAPRMDALLWWHRRFQSDIAHKWWRQRITAAMRAACAE